MQRIIIFANGDLPDLEKARLLIRADDYILCADGGTHQALALGLTPSLIIGDMDSLAGEIRQAMQEAGVSLEPYPRDKDETDLELAIRRALEMKPTEILIVGALGNRLDQTLGNLSLLSDVQLSTFNIRIDDGVEEVLICRDQVQVQGRSGDIVSLIPWGNEVRGVVTENLKWTLRGETLLPYKTRGISNEMLADAASIRIQSGLLLVIHTRKG